MDKMPTISIITVCYNSTRTIEETLRSVISQDYPNVEYIVIDGGSTDGTVDILQKYAANITKIISEPDEGIYHAMNKGISQATGEIIGFLNADDLYAHFQVLSQIATQFACDDIKACYGDLIYFSSQQPNRVYRYWRSSVFAPGAFAKGWSPPHPTFFVRSSVYRLHGGFDLRYSMGNDIELMMRFLEKHGIRSVYMPSVLVKMRIGGVSNQSIKNIIEQNKNIIQAARHLNLPLFGPTFFLGKLLNRLSQFILKPRSECHYVK